MTILFQPAPDGTTHFLRFASGHVVWCKVEQGDNNQLILKEWDSFNQFWVPGVHAVEHYQTAGLMSIDDFPGESASPAPDNAPAGATHYYSHGGELSWYRETENGLFVWRDGSWYASTYKTALDLAKVCPLGAVSTFGEEKQPERADDALTWLARNVHYWGLNTDLCLVYRGNQGQYQYEFSVRSGFTKDQWLFRRAELQNKPSWKDAPEWAKWQAQHSSGFWCWGNATPECQHNSGVGVWDSILVDGKNHTEEKRCEWSGIAGEVLGDWRDTLERRPEVMTTTVSQKGLDHLANASMEAIAAAEPAQATFSEVMDWFERGELPPVGTECEIFGKDANPEKCKIIAYHKDQVAVQWESFGGGILDVLYLREDYWKFRPIRTERDMLMDAIVSQGFLSRDGGVCGRIADAILAAGFKRQGGVV